MAHSKILQGRIGENPRRNQGEVVSRISDWEPMDYSGCGLHCVRQRVYHIDEIRAILSDIGEMLIGPQAKVQPNR